MKDESTATQTMLYTENMLLIRRLELNSLHSSVRWGYTIIMGTSYTHTPSYPVLVFASTHTQPSVRL